MLAFFTSDEAPGAIPNGTLVEKINSDPEDAHGDGSKAKVAGSLCISDIPDFEEKYGYFVRWDDLPEAPVFVTGSRIQRVVEGQT